MKHAWVAALLGLGLIAAASPNGGSGAGTMNAGAETEAEFAEANLASLIDAERSFAATSVERGMKSAFLANLRDDAVLFRPGPLNGKQLWRNRPDSKGTLAWAPSFAEVSGFGDLGFTYGPWEFRGPDAPGGHWCVTACSSRSPHCSTVEWRNA